MLCQRKHKNLPFFLLMPPEAAKFFQNLCQKHKILLNYEGGGSLEKFKNLSLGGVCESVGGGGVGLK